jgi:hypothetical protein
MFSVFELARFGSRKVALYRFALRRRLTLCWNGVSMRA